MNKIGIVTAAICVLAIAGCAKSTTKPDNYQQASFELCNTDVKLYSVSDDGRVRIICADGSKFALNSQKTLQTMRNINIDYCNGEGLGKFNETRNYYSFQCKSGALLSIAKD